MKRAGSLSWWEVDLGRVFQLLKIKAFKIKITKTTVHLLHLAVQYMLTHAKMVYHNH